MKPAGSVRISLEILRCCLRQPCYPDKQVANCTSRNLLHNTLIQQWSYSPNIPVSILLWPHFLCPLSVSDLSQVCQHSGCRAAPSISTVKNNLGLGGCKRARTRENANSTYCKAFKPTNRQVNLSYSHKWDSHAMLDTQELLTPTCKLSAHRTALGLYTHHKLTPSQMALHHHAHGAVSCPVQLSWEQITGSSVMKVECYNDLF